VSQVPIFGGDSDAAIYATVNDIKAYLRINDTQDDGALGLALKASSRQIDAWCSQTFDEDDPPAPVKLACMLQASRLVKRRDSPFGVAGSPEFGSELRLLSKLDPDVENLLRPYRIPWTVA
jgi:hypothetical protein